METKVCTKCGVEKPLEEFTIARKGKAGRAARCRACLHLYRLEYRSRPEVMAHDAARQKEYYARPEIKERRQAQALLYYARPEIKERRKKYYASSEVKEREKKRTQTPDKKAQKSLYRKLYAQRPIISEYLASSDYFRRQGLHASNVPPELMELKMQQILLGRELRKRRKEDVHETSTQR